MLLLGSLLRFSAFATEFVSVREKYVRKKGIQLVCFSGILTNEYCSN